MSAKTQPGRLKPGPSRQMLRRTLFLMAVCGIGAFVVLLGRLYQLQIIDHEKYESMAIEQQLRSVPSSAMRGVIYDTNMNTLAVSASVDNVYLSPAEIEMYGEDRELIARGLSEILDISYDEIYEKTGQKGSWYVTVARKLEQDKADEVRAFKTENNLRGVRLETDTKRYYPNSSLACHLIGFVGTDNYGLEGIEAQYNEALSGSPGRTVRATNALGTELLFSQFEEYYPGEDGYDLVTTIDASIQYYVEKHLKQAVEDYDIQNGAGAIAMDVNTGEILAMASLGNYDLNDFLAVSDEDMEQINAASDEEEKARLLSEAQTRQWRNKALSDTYEPGSTFKIITLAMALEEGAVSMEDSFYCPGSVNVIGRTSPIRCWKTQGHGSQTLTQAAQHSCNVAFVNIGQRVGAERFYDYCEAFGFLNMTGNDDENLTAKTGIDLAGESGSIWWSKNTFCSEKNLSQLAAASFGQTFTITPLQLVTAVSACVNGGNLMQPYVVRQMLNPDGSVAYERSPKVVRQVISEETSATVRNILEQVVGDQKEGTGHNAYVAGYRIGGKTGTSTKTTEEIAGNKEYIVSFIGFAPADDPEIAILVLLDDPSSESGIYISGGQMAAPVVGKMMADILPYLGYEPEYTDAELENIDRPVPEVAGMSLAEAQRALTESGFKSRIIGEGDTVTDQLPRSGVVIASGSEVLLYAGQSPAPTQETMPDVRGLSYAEAVERLGDIGVYLSSGNSSTDAANLIVSGQSIAPGTAVEHGTVVDVTLYLNDTSMLGIY
mgnify:CR=1 FL=1